MAKSGILPDQLSRSKFLIFETSEVIRGFHTEQWKILAASPRPRLMAAKEMACAPVQWPFFEGKMMIYRWNVGCPFLCKTAPYDSYDH